MPHILSRYILKETLGAWLGVTGVLLVIQGIAQVMRCILCIRTGEWLVAEEDAEETEVRLMREAAERGGIR